MGIRINPCHGCPIGKGCDRRNELRAKVSGIGAVSVSFRCERLKEELRSGRRIRVPAVSIEEGSAYDGEPKYLVHRISVPATIIHSYDDGTFTCVVDPGALPENEQGADTEKFRFRKRMRHARIHTFLDEPDMPLCKLGRVLRNGACDRGPDDPCWCKDGPLVFGETA